MDEVDRPPPPSAHHLRPVTPARGGLAPARMNRGGARRGGGQASCGGRPRGRKASLSASSWPPRAQAPVHPLSAGRRLAMGIALILAAAVGYGASDFLAEVSGRRGHAAVVALLSQPLGLVTALLGLWLFPWTGLAPASLGWKAVCGVGSTVGIFALYRALAIGEMTVVSTLADGAPSRPDQGGGLLSAPGADRGGLGHVLHPAQRGDGPLLHPRSGGRRGQPATFGGGSGLPRGGWGAERTPGPGSGPVHRCWRPCRRRVLCGGLPLGPPAPARPPGNAMGCRADVPRRTVTRGYASSPARSPPGRSQRHAGGRSAVASGRMTTSAGISRGAGPRLRQNCRSRPGLGRLSGGKPGLVLGGAPRGWWS